MAALTLYDLWWAWLAFALGLAILEVLAPGFIFLGFAVGAAAMALVVLAAPGLGLPVLLAIFAVISLLAWIVLRKLFRATDDQSRVIHEDINK